MFQAEAGRGNTASVRSTSDAISDTVATYAISDQQGARKKILDNRQRTAVNSAGMGKTIVVLLIGLALASVHLVEAQQQKRIPLVGVLVAGSPSSMATRINAFQQKLRELGYTEGRNIVVEYHYASDSYDRL